MTGGTHTGRRTCSRNGPDPTIGPVEVPSLEIGKAGEIGLATISYKFVQQLFASDIIVDIH